MQLTCVLLPSAAELVERFCDPGRFYGKTKADLLRLKSTLLPASEKSQENHPQVNSESDCHSRGLISRTILDLSFEYIKQVTVP